jgi:hypothetical protein
MLVDVADDLLPPLPLHSLAKLLSASPDRAVENRRL